MKFTYKTHKTKYINIISRIYRLPVKLCDNKSHENENLLNNLWKNVTCKKCLLHKKGI